MPIRPIDMITIAPKSQEAANHQLASQHRTAQSQANIQNQFQQHVRNNGEQVVHPSKSENPKQRYDAKEKGNGSYSQDQKRKKKDNQEESKKQEDTIKLSNFDIKI